jgi:hypothetical protein
MALAQAQESMDEAASEVPIEGHLALQSPDSQTEEAKEIAGLGRQSTTEISLTLGDTEPSFDDRIFMSAPLSPI